MKSVRGHLAGGTEPARSQEDDPVAPFVIETAGYAPRDSIDSVLRVDPRKSSCAKIRDGVVLAHGKHGGWLISYDDLMRIASEATIWRQRKRRGAN